jgi:Leucine Rich repeat
MQTGFRLIVLTGMLCLLGCRGPTGNPAEQEAIAVITKLGGKVELDRPGAEGRVVKVYLHSTRATDADLASLVKLPKLKNLFLGKTGIGDAGLQHVAKCQGLETLSLNSCPVTDNGVESLATLKQLKTLNLQETSITKPGLAKLQKALSQTRIAHHEL